MSAIVQNNTRLKKRYTDHVKGFVFNIWVLFIVLVLIWGMYISDHEYITAENGLGYWLGIIGGSMLLLLLSYSLRKRYKAVSHIFSLKTWFRFHMFLGVVGPVLVLFHSNFSFGSPNSNVAMVSMLLVSGSGLIGRFLYNGIHYNLYGEKIRLGELRKDFMSLNKVVDQYVVTDEQKLAKKKYIAAMEAMFQAQANTKSFVRLLSNRKKARRNEAFIKKFLFRVEYHHAQNATGTANFKKTHAQLRSNIEAIMKIVHKLPTLEIYERLFSLWHVVHVPIFFLMLLTGIGHVIVVHMY